MAEEIPEAVVEEEFTYSLEVRGDDGGTHTVDISVKYPSTEPKTVTRALQYSGTQNFIMQVWATLTGLFAEPPEQEGSDG